jgi:alpha,alpha-trehalase
VLPVYIGDDETDEDAFAALAGRGLGILVADRPQKTEAEYRLESPEAVGEFLRRLIATFNTQPAAMTDWQLTYDTFDPAEEPLREALCTLGNGYFATRGAAEEPAPTTCTIPAPISPAATIGSRPRSPAA